MLKSGKDEVKLGGASLDRVLILEEAGMKESTGEHNIRQRLKDKIGIAAFTTIPKGKIWMYKLYKRGLHPDSKRWK